MPGSRAGRVRVPRRPAPRRSRIASDLLDLRRIGVGSRNDQCESLDGFNDEPLSHAGSRTAARRPPLPEQLDTALGPTGRNNRDRPPDHRLATDRDRYPPGEPNPKQLLGNLPSDHKANKHQAPRLGHHKRCKQKRRGDQQHPASVDPPPRPVRCRVTWTRFAALPRGLRRRYSRTCRRTCLLPAWGFDTRVRS